MTRDPLVDLMVIGALVLTFLSAPACGLSCAVERHAEAAEAN